MALVTWTLEGVTLAGGGTVTGWFEVDSASLPENQNLAAFYITVSAGASVSPKNMGDYVYEAADTYIFDSSQMGPGQGIVNIAIPATDSPLTPVVLWAPPAPLGTGIEYFPQYSLTMLLAAPYTAMGTPGVIDLGSPNGPGTYTVTQMSMVDVNAYAPGASKTIELTTGSLVGSFPFPWSILGPILAWMRALLARLLSLFK